MVPGLEKWSKALWAVSGFGLKAVASLMSIFAAGRAIGAVCGGWLGDRAEQKFPGKGRIMCAQFSSFMGIPCSLVLLRVLPPDSERWGLFACMFVVMGLSISWCQACANNPMFADVVPEQQRTVIYSFDRAFEGGFGALAAPLLGILAERVYGYRAHMVIPEGGSPAEALALSRGLFAVMAIPFGLSCLCYTPLYFTYSKDKEEARAHNPKHAYNPIWDEE
jgi:MFS family permease